MLEQFLLIQTLVCVFEFITLTLQIKVQRSGFIQQKKSTLHLIAIKTIA